MTHEWTVLALLLCIGMVSTGLAQNTSDPQVDETVLEWPRVEVSEGDAVVQYQPQIDLPPISTRRSSRVLAVQTY